MGGDPTIKSTYKRAKKHVFESIFARAVRPKREIPDHLFFDAKALQQAENVTKNTISSRIFEILP